METWIWLLILYRIIASTTPYTSKVGSFLGVVSLIGGLVFCVLCFFFAPEWWYGLVAFGIYFAVALFIPKIDPYRMSSIALIYSAIFSHTTLIIVLLMYLSLFGVI